jgi:MtN3 and saliva related transmembrane protein
MLFDTISLSILAIAAGILILSGWVHQIIKGHKTKSLKDVSKYLLVLIGVGAILWLIYGIEVADPFIIGTNLAAVVLMVIVFAMKRRYDKLNRLNQKT